VLHIPDDGFCDDNYKCTNDSCDPVAGCLHENIEGCGGPYFELVGVPEPSTVFNNIAVTYYYPNNLVNGCWHGPSNLIIVGHAYGNGYWSYSAAQNNYTTTPNKGSGDYDRMVHVPSTGVVIHTDNQFKAAPASGIWVGTADLQTGELSAFQKANFKEGFSGTCTLMSNSATQFMCFDGVDSIRHYDTQTGSNVLSHTHTTNLSPTPTEKCNGSCYQGTFAWDGMYYYFTSAGSNSGNRTYEVFNKAGNKVGTYTASGSGAISGAYFDWSVGRYVTHDGWGNRSGGATYKPSNGSSGDDSQCYSPVSPWHAM